MKIIVELGSKQKSVNTSIFVDISIPVSRSDDQLSAFYLSKPSFAPVEVGSFVGDTRKGGSVNCQNIVFCPHGNGTHTECVGHATQERITVVDVLRDQPTFVPALLITIQPEEIGTSGDSYKPKHLENDLVVSSRSVKKAYEDAVKDDEDLKHSIKAIVIRTLPNPSTKRLQKWSGKNPVYLTPQTTSYLATLNIDHLLIDLPSVDREEDEGMLESHRHFWQFFADQKTSPPKSDVLDSLDGFSKRTITELCYIDDAVKDGLYLLNLQVSPFESDAAPSRPLLYPMSQ